MRVVITGARGMLGQDLAQKFSTSHDVISLSKGEMDITSENLVRTKMRQIAPDVILHAAAFTRVDDAETNREKSFQINAQGTRNVAVAAAECQASLVYYSTDYVFSGQCSMPYQESDLPDPVNYYGFTKLQGEREIQSLCPAHLIIRTSWLFGKGGENFVCTIARAARERGELEVVEDQHGKPTWTSDLAEMSLALVEDERRGLYHVTNSGECSWFEFAREIVSELDLPCQVRPVRTDRFHRPARRPSYSVLDNTALGRDGYPELRSWRDALRIFLGSPETIDMQELVARNKKAYHDYHVLDEIEAGIVLLGTEVKAIREHRVNLKDSFARVHGGEVWLENCHIAAYRHGNRANHEPRRRRKLLLHRREIDKLLGKVHRKGLTLVPLALYFKNGKAKVRLAIARGKKTYDKREAKRKKIIEREIQAQLKGR